MKKLIYLIILVLILGLVLTGCSLLSNVGQVPSTEQKGMPSSTADLVALWHFDEDFGTTVYDSTANDNDGTVSGASWVDGKLGKALSFDGTDYVIVSDSSLLEPDRITVEAWVKKSGTPGNHRYIVSKYLPTKPGSYSSYGLYTASSGGLRFYIGLSSTWVASPDAGTGVWDGDWHHVAGTYDGFAVKLYVDGELVTGVGSTTSDIEYGGTGDLFIGAYTTASYCFSGTIDEVRIWDEALTAAQIEYSYANEILHVDDDWDQWPGAYYTINEALAVAVDDDTIIVHEGTYTDDIWVSSLGTPAGYRITKSVTLLGAQAGIDPAGSTAERVGGESILIRTNGLPYSLFAPNITIDGFMFGSSSPNTGGRLIISDIADNTIIRNCIIQNAPDLWAGHGVYIYQGADNALVEYNTFYKTAWEAIASTGASNATITHNHISASGQHAIQWMNHAGSNNEISYNHISGIVGKNAIQYWGGPGATISHNVIDGGNTMLDGIWLDAVADNSTVSYNQISNTINAGINVRGGCTDAAITDNNISGCGTGVDVVGSITGTVINFNTISGNGMGVSNYYTNEPVDATLNWWGDVSGPYHPTSWWYEGALEITNPDGLGDAVTDHVLYIPWAGQGGFVTGGGWIDSPVNGAYDYMSVGGKASFGFVSKYKKGKNVPDGSTNFVFQAGDLHFHSSSYDWLVVTGSDYAMFKGTGTINGTEEYKFRIWAGDGGKGGDDTFRIKIWEEDEGGLEEVVYDNGNDGNGSDQVIDSGSIIIHTK